MLRGVLRPTTRLSRSPHPHLLRLPVPTVRAGQSELNELTQVAGHMIPK